ncbi:PREDICTED: palmitoyl-protein thioesterase 1-like [Camelina sativa]|uniref:Palmitoyl-protein thioesterase 1-like n=1 Tax=Camelina sativa TaxID=90675 RepID=A0ABM1QPZ0_CAMSA|nr:PREDICTED: palmitoyl-protein thioesterase 1-like [Camelina sativa]
MEKGLKWSCVAVVVAFLAMVDVSVSVPFIMLHGIIAGCSDNTNANFTLLLHNLSGSPGFCVEIGNGVFTSMFMPLAHQAEIACEKVKQMKELSKGYNIVARSQGNLVARGLIEFCDGGPPVYNYISLAGPHAGISFIPMCNSSPYCKKFDEIIKRGLYSDFAQDHLAPSGYFKIPTDMTKYLESSKYLPRLNNGSPNQRNSTYKKRFASLHNLVLVKVWSLHNHDYFSTCICCFPSSPFCFALQFQDDQVIVPNESTWFGFYPDGDLENVLPA